MKPNPIEALLRRVDESTKLPQVPPPEEVVFRARQRANARAWKRVVPLGVAAAMLLATCIIWFAISSPRSVAAAELLEAVKGTRAFDGWIHITMEVDGKPDAGSMHFQVTEGTIAEMKPGGEISFKSASRGTAILYDPATKIVRLNEAAPEQIRQYCSAMAGILTLGGFLDTLADRSNHVTIEKVIEGNHIRFDTSSTDGKGDVKNVVVWIDPAAKRIVKLKEDSNVYTVTYGALEFRDEYDAGVPRDAIVQDGRPSGRIKEALDQIDASIVKGVGDGILVMMVQPEQGTAGWMNVYAARGEAFLEFNFAVGPNSNPATGRAPRPRNWPTPGTLDVLDFVAKTTPQNFFVWTKEHRGFGGAYDELTGKFTGRWRQGTEDRVEAPSWGLIDPWDRLSHTMAYELWPGRHKMGLLSSDSGRADRKFEVVEDEKRPDLLGIRVGVEELWVDVRRNNVPAEFVDGRIGRRMSSLEYAQLPDGRWYASAYRVTYQDVNPRKDVPPNKRISNYQLLFDPNADIPEQWFTDPTKRVRTEPDGR